MFLKTNISAEVQEGKRNPNNIIVIKQITVFNDTEVLIVENDESQISPEIKFFIRKFESKEKEDKLIYSYFPFEKKRVEK